MNKTSVLLVWMASFSGLNAFAFDAPAEFARAQSAGTLEMRVADVSGEFVHCDQMGEYNLGEACVIRAWITYPKGMSCEFTSDLDQHFGLIVVPKDYWIFGSETGYHIARFGFHLIALPAQDDGIRMYYGVPAWMGNCDQPIEH